MIFSFRTQRPGTSLVELLMFLGFFAICASVVVSFLAFSSEQRVRQRAVLDTEQEGAQLLQMLTRRIRSAEAILYPPQSSTGSALVLQLSDETMNPTVMATESGALKVAEHNSVRTLSTQKLAISHMEFYNTSSSARRQSVTITFDAEYALPLPTQQTYKRTFQTLVTLFPDDNPQGDSCGCASPTCTADVLSWNVCDAEECTQASNTLPCP
jgi:type II secretory pathway pseudopilin PulG